ncbi:septal ring lytic transglycosylase RlpA family lipoprotein, partial [Rhizobium ruizarguesonis]
MKKIRRFISAAVTIAACSSMLPAEGVAGNGCGGAA